MIFPIENSQVPFPFHLFIQLLIHIKGAFLKTLHFIVRHKISVSMILLSRYQSIPSKSFFCAFRQSDF